MRCKVFSIDSNSKRPTIDDIVGNSKAPQNILVADTGSDNVGVAGFCAVCSSSSSLLVKMKETQKQIFILNRRN